MERHDHFTWHDDQLSRRLSELAEINKPWQRSDERREQIAREMSIIAFECAERHRERLNQEIEEAWHGRAGT